MTTNLHSNSDQDLRSVPPETIPASDHSIRGSGDKRQDRVPVARWLSLALIGGGAVLTVLTLTADVTGLGDGDGFGWKQQIATIVGLVMVIGGLGPLIQPFGPSATSTDEPLHEDGSSGVC